MSDGWTYLPATLRCPTEPLSCAPPRTRSSQPATLSGSPSRGCCVRRRSLRAACWGERVAGRIVKFFESRSRGGQKARLAGFVGLVSAGRLTKSRHTQDRSPSLKVGLTCGHLSADTQRPETGAPPRTRSSQSATLSGNSVSAAFACWGVRVASGPVKFFGSRGGQTDGPCQAADKG